MLKAKDYKDSKGMQSKTKHDSVEFIPEEKEIKIKK